MKKLIKAYPVVLTPVNEGGFAVTIPDLNLNTQGEDIADAIFMARDAISLWGISEQDIGRSIPEPSTNKPKHGKSDIVTWVDVNFDDYRNKYDTTAVKVNVTIPRYLKNKAVKSGINFSKELQEALKEKLAL